MTAVSYSLSHGKEANLEPASDITQGTSAPGVGDIEVRVTTGTGITQKDLWLALERIWKFAQNPVTGNTVQIDP